MPRSPFPPTTDAMRQLERLADHYGSLRALAPILGCTAHHLCDVLGGRMPPGRALAARIAEAARQVTKHSSAALARLAGWPGELGYRAAMLETRRAG